jgi:hypothetical protein
MSKMSIIVLIYHHHELLGLTDNNVFALTFNADSKFIFMFTYFIFFS